MKKVLTLILVFVIAFSLGYFVSIPKHITFDIKLDDNFVTMTENIENLTNNEFKEELEICDNILSNFNITYDTHGQKLVSKYDGILEVKSLYWFENNVSVAESYLRYKDKWYRTGFMQYKIKKV